MCTLKDFDVSKNAGPDQEVYLFVIQGMKERMKSDFFNKRQQQVEDTQRQQQQIAQEENYMKQLTFGQQVSSNRDQLGTLPRNDSQFQQERQPPHNAWEQQHPPYDEQHQRHFQDQGLPPQPPHMGRMGYHQDEPVGRPQQGYQHAPPMVKPRMHQPRNDFRNAAQPSPPPAQRNDFDMSHAEPMRQQGAHYPEQHRVDEFIPPTNQGPPRGVVPGGVPVLPMAPIQKRPANEGPPLIVPGQAEKPSGWNCSKCTYLNEPYRPGCKMCSAERPENYEVPVGHVASADELRFINEVHQ